MTNEQQDQKIAILMEDVQKAEKRGEEKAKKEIIKQLKEARQKEIEKGEGYHISLSNYILFLENSLKSQDLKVAEK